MIRTALFFLLAGFLLCSCQREYEEKSWNGLTEQELTKKLGEPTESSMFRLSSDSRLYEHQSGLYRFAPKNKGESFEVKELQWKTWRQTTAVWLRQDEAARWVVIDALVWSAGVVH